MRWCVLDDGDFKLALDAAEARLATQAATVARIDQQIAAARIGIDQAKAQLDAAVADKVRAEADFARAQQLFTRDVGAKATLDKATADRDRTKAMEANAQGALSAAEVNVKVLQAQRQEAARAADELKVARDRAKRDLDFTVIRAPFAGVVANKSVQAGDYVSPGKRLMALVPVEAVFIDANFKETQIKRIRPGATAHIAVDAYPDRDILGTVESLAPGSGAVFSLLPPENATGNFTKIVQRVPVRIKVPADIASEGKLRPGLSVVVEIDTRTPTERRHSQKLRVHRPFGGEVASEASGGSRRLRIRTPAARIAMTDTTLAAVPAPADRIDPMRVVAFAAMIFGMFMAILDIQIVSASLAEIQAGLSASADEISWVQTAYLIAEVVMIPLSGFLSRALSTRVLFATCAAGFTLASALCATATTIDEMILYRAIQGFIGGGMIPSVFAASFTLFRGKQRAVVTPLIGLIATLAPTIGPTIGGYLTQAFSWHWLFLINVGPGIAVTLAAIFLINFDKPDRSLLKHLDWLGLIGMAAFLGSLEYVLEEGPNHDWLQDETVFNCAIVLLIGAVMFFWRAFTAHEPIVDIWAYRDRNFAFGSLLSGRARRRALWPDLSLSGLSGAGARL